MFPAQPSPDSGMRGDRSSTNCAPGAIAPTVFQLLLTRLEDHVEEAGITQNAVCTAAVADFCAAVPDPQLDTLAALALTVLNNHIDAAMHSCSPLVGGSSVASYLSSVALKATASYTTANNIVADENENTRMEAAIRARVDPYIVACERRLYLNNADVPADLQALITNHAPGSLKDPLVEAAEQVLHAVNTPNDPTSTEETALIQALENLAVVQAMYANKLTVGSGAQGGTLPNIRFTDACKAQKHFDKHVERFYKNAPTGMLIYAALVQPSRRPTFLSASTPRLV